MLKQVLELIKEIKKLRRLDNLKKKLFKAFITKEEFIEKLI